MTTVRTITFGIALVAGLLGGCSARVQWMHQVQNPQPLQPTADRALVIVMRPSHYGSAAAFTIVDSEGHYLGNPMADGYYGILVPPGQHMLFALSENVSPLQLNVAPARTYFVIARPHMGAWKARVNLTKVAPGSEDWSRVSGWLHGTYQYTVDFAGGQQRLDQKRQEIAAKVQKGMKVWQELDPKEREEHTVRPGDGV